MGSRLIRVPTSVGVGSPLQAVITSVDKEPGTEPRGSYGGWLFLDRHAVPERWRERAVEVLLVPRLPAEAEQVLEGNRGSPEIAPEDERLASLVARGIPVPEIATELGLTPRSVERRLARLRDQLGVGSTAELVAFLSQRGF